MSRPESGFCPSDFLFYRFGLSYRCLRILELDLWLAQDGELVRELLKLVIDLCNREEIRADAFNHPISFFPLTFVIVTHVWDNHGRKQEKAKEATYATHQHAVNT